MYNKKSLKNLKKFSAENQPEKKGRRKGSLSLTNEIRKVLESVDEKSQKTVAEILAHAVTKHAMHGKAAYFKLIIERIDGKVPDQPEYTDKGPKNVQFEIVYEKAKKPVD